MPPRYGLKLLLFCNSPQLREIEDDGGWAECKETIEELTVGEETEILAGCETEILRAYL